MTKALTPVAVAAAIKTTEYKYFGDYQMSDDQREAVDVLVEVARRYCTPASIATGSDERAREVVRDALMDSQYLAGVTAGWNAAQADDPEHALASIQKSREGHLSGYAEAKAVLVTARKVASEAFGYWVEQKHAEPVLLRKPAYIPEPSDLRTVTPLYRAASRPTEAGAGGVTVPVETLREWYTQFWAFWVEATPADDDTPHPTPPAMAEMEATLNEALATPKPPADVAIWSGEHRAYWRRGSRGEGASYTLNLDEAGVWSRDDAIRLTSHCGPEKLIALHDRPNLTGDGAGA